MSQGHELEPCDVLSAPIERAVRSMQRRAQQLWPLASPSVTHTSVAAGQHLPLQWPAESAGPAKAATARQSNRQRKQGCQSLGQHLVPKRVTQTHVPEVAAACSTGAPARPREAAGLREALQGDHESGALSGGRSWKHSQQKYSPAALSYTQSPSQHCPPQYCVLPTGPAEPGIFSRDYQGCESAPVHLDSSMFRRAVVPRLEQQLPSMSLVRPREGVRSRSP